MNRRDMIKSIPAVVTGAVMPSSATTKKIVRAELIWIERDSGKYLASDVTYDDGSTDIVDQFDDVVLNSPNLFEAVSNGVRIDAMKLVSKG